MKRNNSLTGIMTKLFAMGVEARGVERVLEQDRSPKG